MDVWWGFGRRPTRVARSSSQKADIAKVPCHVGFGPRKQTFSEAGLMSAKCQKRTSRSTQRVPHCPGHGDAEQTLADPALFVEPQGLFLPFFAGD